jgi:tetratricopeptide (TPR) repeat protein
MQTKHRARHTPTILGSRLAVLVVATACSLGTSPLVASSGIDPDAFFLAHGPGIMLASNGDHDDDGGERSSWRGERAYDRAMDDHEDGEYAAAIAGFERARELGYRPAASAYKIACGHALLGNTDRALEWLERAYDDEGFRQSGLLREDSDLDPIRGDQRFRALLDRFADRGDDDHRWHGRHRDRLEDAEDDLARLERRGSTDGDAWYEAGTDLLSLRQLDRAEAALAKAAELLGGDNHNALYNLACAQAIGGKTDAAFATLGRAIDAGFDDADHMADDADLRSLRRDRRFTALMDRAEELSLDPWMDGYERHFSVRHWGPAADHFQTIVDRQPTSGRAWFALGYALHYSRQHDRAAAAFSRAAELGYRVGTSRYDEACALAMQDDVDGAFRALDAAVEAGFEGDWGLDDPDLDSLRDDPRFDRLAERLDDGDHHHVRFHFGGWRFRW